MNGFVRTAADDRLPTRFVEMLPKETVSRTLHLGEWKIVVGLTRKIIEVVMIDDDKSR